MTSTRAPAVAVLVAAALAATMLLLPATSGAARSRVIQADNVIGGYKVKKDGSLAGAIAVFGKPSSTKRRGSACNVRWKRLGIRSTFADFGGGNPCAPADGRFTSATIAGKGWRTASGLKIRNSWKRIPKLHPNARFNGSTSPSGPW